MTPLQFWEKHSDADPNRIKAVCKAAGTKPINLKHIAVYGGACSKSMAKRLAEASDGEMSILEILYPEDYADTSAA